MKRILKLMAMCLMTLSFSACNDENKPLVEEEHYIDIVSENAFTVGYEGEILSVEIDANCQWSISKTDADGNGISWIKTDVASDKGPKAFRIKVLKNNTAESRTGTVNIYSEQVTAYIDITQEANPSPGAEPEPEIFKGYDMPVYQMLESPIGIDVTGGTVQEIECNFSNASVEGNVITFADGLVIEKTGETAADIKMACPSHTKPASYAGFQLGISAQFGTGDSWIYKIPMNSALYGDLRFTYGSRKEGTMTEDKYKWSSDNGQTWNDVTKVEAVKSDAVFKSVWFTIPQAQAVPREGSLWFKVTPAPSGERVFIQNGIAIEKASAELSSLPAQDNTTIVLSEGFDAIAGVNASYLTVPGFMKGAVTGHTNKGTDTVPYAPENSAISVSHCFARPGFLQVGYSDEAQTARCGWNGVLTLNLTDRLAEMGVTGTTDLIVKFKAATMTNAFGVKADADIVVKAGETELAHVENLEADSFSSYELKVTGVNAAEAVLVITSRTNASKKDSGTAASTYESADYRFFIDDLVVEIASASEVPSSKTLTFDFTSNPGDWPTNKKRTASIEKHYYTLDGEQYEFIFASPKDAIENGSQSESIYNEEKCFLEITNKRYIGLPALEGLRLTKVECTHGSVDHTNRQVSIVSDADKTSTEEQAIVSGGEVQLFTTQGEVYTYSLTGTTANTVYYILCSKTGVGISSITLTYEP